MNLYNFILHRTFSGPAASRAFRAGLQARMAYFRLRDALGGLLYRHPNANSTISADLIRNILIVRTDRIGDIVLSTPVLNVLRKHLPGVRITYAIQKKYRPLLDCYSGWDETVELTDVHDKSEIRETGMRLRRSGFDVAFIQHPSSYGYLLGHFARPRYLIGWRAKGYGHLCSHALPDDRNTAVRHQVENNTLLLSALGITVSPNDLSFPVRETPNGLAQADRFYQSEPINRKKPVLVIHPGSFSPRVQWLPEGFASVADCAIRAGVETVVLGDASDRPVIDEVLRNMTEQPVVAVNRFDLQGLVSFFRRATAFLGNSTGPMHIASSAGIWTFAVFGNKYGLDREEMWRPWGKKGVAISRGNCHIDKCIPWTCRDMVCMKSIKSENVWEMIRQKIL